MRKILLLLLITMLISCDIAIFDEKLSLNGENPFLNPTEITRDADEDDTLSFIVLTDAHLNREYRDSGIHRNEDNLFYFLDQNKDDIDAILLLGDMIDDGVEMDYERMHVFLDDLRSHTRKDIQIIYALGNHEPNKGSTEEDWEKEFDISSMEAFIIEDTMIYKLNSAYRIFGSDQINALKYAMRENSEKYGTRYNFVITHVPLGAKGLNQSLFEFTIADADERNAMLKTIAEGGSTFTLSGHHHKGEVLNSWSAHHKEYIFPAFHGREAIGDLESEGWYHLVTLDQGTGEVMIKAYQIDSDNPSPDDPERKITFSI